MDSYYFGVKTVLIIFKILGLAPWSLADLPDEKNESSNNVEQSSQKPTLHCSKLGCVYPMVLGVFMFFMWIMDFPPWYIVEGYVESPVTTIITGLYNIAGNVIVVALRILLCVKQKTVVELFNRFTNIGGTIVSLANGRNLESNGQFFLLLFSINTLVITGNIVASKLGNGDILTYLIEGILPDVIVNWFIMQYVVTVRLVNRQFRSLNQALLASSRYPDVQAISLLTSSVIAIELDHRPKFLTFRRTHTELYELGRDVSEFYSLPILFAIAHECYSLVYCAFYNVVPVLIGKEYELLHLTIHSLLWMTVTMLPIFVLASGVDEADYEMKRTSRIVHELLGQDSISREDKAELRQFSLELLNRKILYTASGLFPLDSTLLRSICSGVIRYLVIIAQFHFVRGQ